jgi:SAM-dependent MidA family methyltransferase
MEIGSLLLEHEVEERVDFGHTERLLSKSVAEPNEQHDSVTDIATILRLEIEQARVISFARFMQLALYCPETGFYERQEHQIGRPGDFYTSVSVGAVFGELLAFQFAQWLERYPTATHVVEAGAHNGQLAVDVLGWFRKRRPELFSRLEYILLEPSIRRQGWQRDRLVDFADRVRWYSTIQDGAANGVRGIIFSNELLDAFPAHVLRWDALERRWREWGITRRGGEFAWERMATDVTAWSRELKLAGFDVPSALGAHLPDGFTVEFSPSAAQWWHQAATSLRSGKLLTIDYGGTAEELLSPQRTAGTLRGYSQHRHVEDVLANPGLQDITAHVNFTQLRNVGEGSGLRSDALMTQASFLERILVDRLTRQQRIGNWGPAQLRQFQTLTHPEHLGRSFRVLIQSREE